MPGQSRSTLVKRSNSLIDALPSLFIACGESFPARYCTYNACVITRLLKYKDQRIIKISTLASEIESPRYIYTS